MEQTLIQQVLLPILIALVAGLTGLIGYGFKYLYKYLQLKIDNMQNSSAREELTFLLSQAEDQLQSAVMRTNQVLVDKLRDASKDGTLTKQEMEAAMQSTINIFKKTFGDENYNKLYESLPDLTEWITSKIEQYVRLNK